MNWLDIVMLVIVGLSVFTGLKNGLIKTVFSLVGMIIGIFIAGSYYKELAGVLTFIPNEDIAGAVAFIIIMGVVALIANLLGLIVKKIVHSVMLGWADHLGGAVAGFFSGAISIAALLTLWVKFTNGIPDPVEASRFANILLDKFPIVLGMLPDEFDAIRSFFE